jgi:hypothetical protein
MYVCIRKVPLLRKEKYFTRTQQTVVTDSFSLAIPSGVGKVNIKQALV